MESIKGRSDKAVEGKRTFRLKQILGQVKTGQFKDPVKEGVAPRAITPAELEARKRRKGVS